MRYQSIGTFIYTDINGKEFNVKKFRPIEKFKTLFELPVDNKVFFDEIASKDDVFGANSETNIYKLTDHNLNQIYSNNFDTSKIKKVRIPA